MDAISKQPSHAALALGAESPDTFRPTKYKHLLNSTPPPKISDPQCLIKILAAYTERQE